MSFCLTAKRNVEWKEEKYFKGFPENWSFKALLLSGKIFFAFLTKVLKSSKLIWFAKPLSSVDSINNKMKWNFIQNLYQQLSVSHPFHHHHHRRHHHHDQHGPVKSSLNLKFFFSIIQQINGKSFLAFFFSFLFFFFHPQLIDSFLCERRREGFQPPSTSQVKFEISFHLEGI